MQTFQIYPIPYGITILSEKIFKHLSTFVQCKIKDNNIQIRNGLKRNRNLPTIYIFISKNQNQKEDNQNPQQMNLSYPELILKDDLSYVLDFLLGNLEVCQTFPILLGLLPTLDYTYSIHRDLKEGCFPCSSWLASN